MLYKRMIKVIGVIFCISLCSCAKESPKENIVVSKQPKATTPSFIPSQFMKVKNGVLEKWHWYEGDKNDVHINLPANIKKIKRYAFSISKKKAEYASNYTPIAVEIPQNVKIQKQAFKNMGPASITFEEGRTSIGKNVFENCGEYGSNITITLPKSIKKIAPYAFSQLYSPNLKLELNEGLEEIEDYALVGTTCNLPATVKKLGKGALQFWCPLNNNCLPKQLEMIGDECFYFTSGNEPKKPLQIPATVKSIGENSIQYETISTNTCGVIVDKRNPYYKSDSNGWLYSKDGTILYHAYCKSKKMILPKNVKEIRCELQLADHEEQWQKIVFPNKKLENEYRQKYP